MTESEKNLIARIFRIGKAQAGTKNEKKAARKLEADGLVVVRETVGGIDGYTLIVEPADDQGNVIQKDAEAQRLKEENERLRDRINRLSWEVNPGGGY